MRNRILALALAASGALALGLAVPTTASAFCGFYVSGADASLYNEATMVVMMRAGTRTVLSMQNTYKGPPQDFAMVVPVPVVLREGDVKTLPHEVFDRVDQLAAPRLVEYWEQDPCYRPPRRRMTSGSRSADIDDLLSSALGGGGRHGVRIEAEFAVAEYDVVVLSASDSAGLDRWLREEHYNIPTGAGEVLRPYVEQGTKFFVAKVDAERVTFDSEGRAELSPLRFHYDSEQFSLPVRLGLLNSQGEQDLIVHILAPGQRYEAANYRNAFIPTNLRVYDRTRSRFGEFYAKLFDETVRANDGAVITEYAWQAQSCDPCPTQPLSESELTVLGLDVLGGTVRTDVSRNAYNGGGMVLTRLHYRYAPGDLGDDLVFRPASPVVGGRGIPNRAGRMSEATQPSSSNQFQGRYVLLHWWAGAVECEHPNRGEWGGPPSGRAAPVAATGTAFAPRRRTPLEHFVRDPIPELERRPRRGAGRDGTRSPSPSPNRDSTQPSGKLGEGPGRARPASAAGDLAVVGVLTGGLFFVSRSAKRRKERRPR